jgi:hypothetical protein
MFVWIMVNRVYLPIASGVWSQFTFFMKKLTMCERRESLGRFFRFFDFKAFSDATKREFRKWLVVPILYFRSPHYRPSFLYYGYLNISTVTYEACRRVGRVSQVPRLQRDAGLRQFYFHFYTTATHHPTSHHAHQQCIDRIHTPQR